MVSAAVFLDIHFQICVNECQSLLCRGLKDISVITPQPEFSIKFLVLRARKARSARTTLSNLEDNRWMPQLRPRLGLHD